ncbi:patched domain-containing protein 3-like isoform X2 [Anneissia japonica]|uniref:patched domain-containing protein 3-like isoform X2 n=2 Tax=Anneissia japonica TaxID=1529436 RepID=UPI0014257919|nr:patched domain-containing protein 3-like isoform X2 [Anneissia japonica]
MKFLGCIGNNLTSVFNNYGKFISRHPYKFLLFPLILSCVLSIGFFYLEMEKDAEYLFTPSDSIARDDKTEISKLFPINYTEFKEGRLLSTSESSGTVMVLPQDSVNLLSVEAIDEIIRLDRKVKSIIIYRDKEVLQYNDLCAKWKGKCAENNFLNALNYNASNILNMQLTYPFLRSGSQAFFIGATFTEVDYVNMSDVFQSAFAFRTTYYLSSTPEVKDLSIDWEYAFLDAMEDFESPHIKIVYLTSNTLSDELVELSERVMPRFSITFGVLFMFAVGSCMMSDWVLSKPWLGQLGIISAALAIMSTGGIMGFAQVPFNQIVSVTPFLAIGIGLDDMFIMLAAWRQTNPKLSVEERMGLAYSEAAVSITITSLTDILAFSIGAYNPLPAIQIFCLYTGVAIAFDYIYQITFFGACMVLIGRREAANRHCYTCKKVLPKKEAKSRLYKIFCAGGFTESDTISKNENEPWLMQFFKNYYGPFIMKPAVKILVLIAFAVYIGLAVWGCTQLREGLELKKLAADDSYAFEAFTLEDEHFNEFGPPVQIVFTNKLNYWESEVQDQLEKIIQSFEKSKYIHSSNFTTSWLHSYQLFLLENNININSLNQTTFFKILREHFLQVPHFQEFSLDINFNSDADDPQITSSRFIVISKNLYTSVDEATFLSEIRNTGRQSPIPLRAFGPTFVYTEQFIIIVPTTLQNLIIATICMFFVALVLIPHPICAVCVTISIASIEAGVIGFMTFWGVNLDGTSMINVILCIGFSVDFTAHVTYAYVIATDEDPNKRAISALHSLGMPIVQGGFSTILGMFALCSAPAYIFRSFFKVMFLVMLFGLFHGLLLLPVILSICGRFMKPKQHLPARQLKGKTEETADEAESALNVV